MADYRTNASDPFPGVPFGVAHPDLAGFAGGGNQLSDAEAAAYGGHVYQSGESRLQIVEAEKTVLLDGHEVCLTKRELELLCALASRAGSTSTRAELSAALYGPGSRVRRRSIDTYVKNLRAKLGDDPTRPRWIETIHGVGYRFIGRPV